MKTKNLHRKLAALVICLAMTFAVSAQTTATTVAELQSQFATAVASGVPSTINIGAAIAVTADLSLVSTGDSITLNFAATPAYPITVTAGTFTIGNKVKITSALGNCVQALAGGTVVVNAGCNITSSATSPVTAGGGNVIINGGKIITVGNYPSVAAGMAINTVATGGSVTVNGGIVYTTATGIARGIVVDYNGVCTINGGQVRSDMGGGRGISINSTNAGGKLIVNGGTISALGATGRAIQLDNLNSTLWVTGGTITGGLEGIMVQKNGVAVLVGNPTITGTIGTNTTTSKLFDARGLSSPVATPGQGYYSASQNVTVTGGTGTIYKYVNTTSQAAATSVTSSLVYTIDGTDPVAASTAVSAPLTMAIPSVLKVAALIDGTTVSPNKAFNYWPTGTPMTSAPTPTVPANRVASIFSDAYQSDDPGTQFRPDWSQPTQVSTIQVGGNDNVMKYSNFSYEGTQFAHNLVVPDMKYLHIDVFTSNLPTFKIGPISPGPVETDATLTLTPNTWNSFDIPVSTFTGVNMSNIMQMGTSGGSGVETVYLDNIYFWTDATTDTQAPTAFTASKGNVTADAVTLLLTATDNSGVVLYDITYGTKTVTTPGLSSGSQSSFTVSGLTGSTDYSFSIIARDRSGNAITTPIVVTATTLTPMPVAPTPTRPAAQVKSIYSDAYTPAVTVTEWSNWWMMTFSDYVFPNGNNAKKVISTNPGGCGSPTFVATPLDATGSTLVHVDVYPTSTFTISLQFITISATTANWVSLGTLIPNQWNSIDIPFSSFTNLVKTDIKQVGFQTTASIGTFYMDNLYFYTDAPSSVATLGTASIKCYPSQVVNSMNVTAETEISNVIVRNLIGQTIKSVTVNSVGKSIDLSAVSAGNYFVTVKLANGQSTTQKIVKL